MITTKKNFKSSPKVPFFIKIDTSSPEEIFFDQVVAALQEIIVNEKFEKIQTKFMKQHCFEFEDSEENKMSYMAVFKNYQNLIEKHIEKVSLWFNLESHRNGPRFPNANLPLTPPITNLSDRLANS